MRILVIKLSSLGDLFHALPAVHCLKVGLEADIDWVTSDCYVDIVSCFNDVDRVIPFYRKSFFRNLKEFKATLRKERYDYILDIQGLFKSAYTGWLADGKKRIGPSFNRECSRLFYNSVAGKKNKNRHAVEENMDFVSFLGVDRLEPEFPVSFPTFPGLMTDGLRVAVAPLSRWETKNWPKEYYIELIAGLVSELKCRVHLIGGPADVGFCKSIVKSVGFGVINCAGKYSLPETGGLLEQMSLLISNDSGPIHMAAAVGTPVLSIFGPTDPARTGAFGSTHSVLQKDLSCRPCFSRECEKGTVQCLKDIRPDEALREVRSMLKNRDSVQV